MRPRPGFSVFLFAQQNNLVQLQAVGKHLILAVKERENMSKSVGPKQQNPKKLLRPRADPLAELVGWKSCVKLLWGTAW